ncbi:NADH dehydrogenase, FAD-containing subunit [Hyella patelloides LEGE 07179]|uniref:NADH:ubiquinone reductase (non-electrogenic) n=1 Tax=Hyella patelloides LEGE 07179 TaxID=945734 RepID=A0A563VJ99_9CYAN|nr:NAD(P)/FAD-dependent oxidoreductase [Hyella patelloides]VEP11387.1 NADH dehydrogenase, FAD-containing subunit [Hyella patelloides LEGE 07179]
MKKYPRVVIVGAGFGGLQTARSLANKEVEVVLIDRNNYNTFIPLLYQVATAQLAPEQVAVPIRTLLRRAANTKFLRAEVTQIDFVAQEIKTDINTLSYDFLVLATGSRSQFLNVSGAEKYTFPLKTLNQAIRLRNHLLSCFEQAAVTNNQIERSQLLTIAIVGGGATGVELAGSLIELITNSLRRDYPQLNPQEVRVLLLQSGDRLFREFPQPLGDYTAKKLRRLGVKVMLGSKVVAVSPEGLELDDATKIATSTVIWAVGVEGAIPRCFPFPEKKQQRQINVLPTLQLIDHPQVFAIGDLARIPSHQKSLSGVAPEALQQGVYVASTIRRQIQGKRVKPFKYFNKGRLAIIGCYSGIGQIAGLPLKGFLPWLFWLAVHVVYVPDWRNRLIIFLTWLHNYLIGDRPSRLIL